MKAKSFILIVCITLISCDDRLEFANRDNRPPRLFFNADESKNAFVDSLKLGTSLKIGSASYALELAAKDPEGKISNVNFRIESGSAKIYSGATLTVNNASIENGLVKLNLFPDNAGTISMTFEVTDNIGKSAVASFSLFSFENLTPVASATLHPTKISGPYEYEFDASTSYDRDRNFGGEITAYEYVINDTQTIITGTKIIKHNFPGPGGYRVKYRVHDNEGAVSPFVTAPQITLQ